MVKVGDKESDIRILKRLLQEARPCWWHLTAIFGLSLLATPLALLTPLPLMLAVDSVIGSEPLPVFLSVVIPETVENSGYKLLLLVAMLVVLIALLTRLQNLSTWLLQTYTGEKLVLQFQSRLLQQAQRLSLSYHDAKGTADAIYRIKYDAPSIQWVVVYGLTPFLTATFTLAGMIYVTTRIDWKLALVALAVSPVVFFLTQIFRKRLRRQWRTVKELEMSALSIIQEVLGALRIVKAFGQEDREHGRFMHRSREGLGARLRVIFRESAFSLSIGLTIAIGTAAVLFIGVQHVQSGLLTLGQLLLVMSYLAQLYQPLQTLSQQVTKLQGGLTGAERAFALLDEAPDVDEHQDPKSLTKAVGTVEFKNVSFSYDDVVTVLKEISLVISPGAKVGIVGKTGAGKSTLVNLLMRFYDPSSGQILLDGIDIREYKINDLRDQFSIVLQDPLLLHTTIAENIAYGRPEANKREIEDAAKAANAHDFICDLPQGYDTQVGERGLRLSGGERQRIALARAFLKDAPILILDEPTSSVDVRTESMILDAMYRLMDGRTTFMISHRLVALERCDWIFRVEGGELVKTDAVVARVTAV